MKRAKPYGVVAFNVGSMSEGSDEEAQQPAKRSRVGKKTYCSERVLHFGRCQFSNSREHVDRRRQRRFKLFLGGSCFVHSAVTRLRRPGPMALAAKPSKPERLSWLRKQRRARRWAAAAEAAAAAAAWARASAEPRVAHPAEAPRRRRRRWQRQAAATEAREAEGAGLSRAEILAAFALVGITVLALAELLS